MGPLVNSFTSRPDMQNAVRRLLRPEDMLETISQLAVKEPDLMRLVLQACVAAIVNVQASSAESVGRFWLRKFSELMKQGDLDVFKRLEAIGFSHSQFGFVVEALHNT